MRGLADLVLVNARVVTLDPLHPFAEGVAARSGRITAVGSSRDLMELVGPGTKLLDAEGAVAVPAFHDAHIHLLSYARSLSSLDCRHMRSVEQIRAALAKAAQRLPKGTWIRAYGYDEALLEEGRHPTRHDLDGAVPDHAVRLQHRSLHLDVLNTLALHLAGLMDATSLELERDQDGTPTGRLYHAAELLRHRLEHRTEAELSRDVRLASERLLAWGVTSVQDASITNGLEEWELFQRLVARGDLRVRVFVLPGARYRRDMSAASMSSSMVRHGPVKFMIDEATSDPDEIRAGVAAVHAAGQAVALHAVSEAEVAIALDAVRGGGPTHGSGPDRIEHGAVISDEWLDDLRTAGVMVVGQPGLVYRRGDMYRTEYLPELHGWLHRAQSLLQAGIPYAVGSDAPVIDPCPGLGLFAARRRQTVSGAVLGPREALTPLQALEACTLAPARAVGAESELGRLQPGALADIAVLDEEMLEAPAIQLAERPVRLTIQEGRLVWSRPERGTATG